MPCWWLPERESRTSTCQYSRSGRPAVPSQVAPLQPRLDGPRVILVDRPDAVQADVRIQQATVGRSHPGWAALKVACGALGGTFGSRLNQVLREDKGWSYGVGMSSRPLPDGGVATVAGPSALRLEPTPWPRHYAFSPPATT